MMGAFLALMASGLPVAMAMAGAALIFVMVSGNVPDFVVIHRMYGGVDSFPLLAVPFFIWAGNLMNSAGITNRIYNFALALVGWLKGGLGHVNVVGSMIFAGMSGTAIADAAGLGTIEIKAMKDHGYSTEFAVGVTAASATVGPIIPPSLPFVIYGMMAGVSIGQLFLAGVIPGVLMGITMMLTVAYFAHTRNFGRDVPFSAVLVNTAWAKQNRPTIDKFLAAYEKGAIWYHDPANRTQAIDILQKESKQDRADVELTYDFYRDLKVLDRDGAIQNKGLADLVALLKEQGDLEGSTELTRFYDVALGAKAR